VREALGDTPRPRVQTLGMESGLKEGMRRSAVAGTALSLGPVEACSK